MRILSSLVFSVLTAGVCTAQEAPHDVMVVFDMSGSMWGQVDGVAKVEIARDAFGNLVADWDASNTDAGLIAYGHRRRGDCTDIELLAQPTEGSDIAALVANLQPRGKTPLSDAVRQAAEVLKFTEEAATVVLLSDGVETCDADPCAVGAELEALGLDFTAHVIGFDIAEADKAQLQCLANATGGQYFDAADSSGLSDAMEGVAQATAVAAPEELRGQDYQEVTIRVRMDARTVALPEEITIYGNDIELGKVTDDTAVVPGLPIQMPFGPITLRVEGMGISGEMFVEITDQSEIIDITAIDAEADYVIWREGQLPVLEGGAEQILLLKNTTGVDRASFYRSFLYPLGSSEQAQALRAGNVAPYAGIYTEVRVPSPSAPGDYELVPTGTDGTEYARIPISFAANIDPVWQGPREVAPGEVFDAQWAGPSNRRDMFRFVQDDQQISRTIVQSMVTENGYKLTAPDVPGVYELEFTSSFENSLGEKTTALGKIAVGVPPPQDDAIDFDTTDFDAEVEAMGGEEFPTLPVGDLHGDWLLVTLGQFGTDTLVKFQLHHAEGDPAGDGGLVVEESRGWEFGPTGTFGEATLTNQVNDGLLMSFTIDGETTDYVMVKDGAGWTTSVPGPFGELTEVLLLKADDFATAEAAADAVPMNHNLVAVDERGEVLQTPVKWTLVNIDTEEQDTFQSADGQGWDEDRAPGMYRVTATSGDLVTDYTITLGRGQRGANLYVMKPAAEGADLALDVSYFCSQGEDCRMEMREIPIEFTLPVGWGAERPIWIDRWVAMFNMTTNTPEGPFFATLNQPQRSADLGPCFDLVSGTFCHDATDDPTLLADIELLKQSLSFRAAGDRLNDAQFDEMLEQLTGATE